MLIVWGSSDHVSDHSRKARTIDSRDKVRTKVLQDLDSNDLETGFTVVISSYQTWAQRTTQIKLRDTTSNPRSHRLCISH